MSPFLQVDSGLNVRRSRRAVPVAQGVCLNAAVKTRALGPSLKQAMQRLKTYLVEDSPVIRDSLVATLQDLTAVQVVGFAEDEATAVRWLLEPSSEVQLGIIDIVLKRGSGLGVLQALHGSGRGLKLVVLSNYVTPDIRRRCLDLGADQVFDKSGEIDALIGYCAGLAAAHAGDG